MPKAEWNIPDLGPTNQYLLTIQLLLFIATHVGKDDLKSLFTITRPYGITMEDK